MATITMKYNSQKYGFRKGDSFPVVLTIMGEIVVIRPKDQPNLIWSERRANYYGVINGTPKLYL